MAKIRIVVQLAPVYLEVDEDATEEEVTAQVESQWLSSRTAGWSYWDSWRN